MQWSATHIYFANDIDLYSFNMSLIRKSNWKKSRIWLRCAINVYSMVNPGPTEPGKRFLFDADLSLPRHTFWPLLRGVIPTLEMWSCQNVSEPCPAKFPGSIWGGCMRKGGGVSHLPGRGMGQPRGYPAPPKKVNKFPSSALYQILWAFFSFCPKIHANWRFATDCVGQQYLAKSGHPDLTTA